MSRARRAAPAPRPANVPPTSAPPVAIAATPGVPRRPTGPLLPAGWAWWQWLLIWLGLAALTGAVYSNTLHAPFIFDDEPHIVDNPLLRPWPPVRSPIWMRPVLGWSLALNYHFSGLQVESYHVTSVAIHLVAGLCLWLLLRHTLRLERVAPTLRRLADPLSLAVTVLWLVHPLATQAVTYTIQRGESLASLFYLLGLYAAARAWPWTWRQAAFWGWWLVAAAALGLSTGSKQIGLTLPVAIGLYYWVFFLPPTWLRRWWPALAGLGVALAGAGWWVAHASAGNEGSVGTNTGMGPGAYLLAQSVVLLRYLWLSLVPYPQCLDYGWGLPPTTLSLPCLLLWVGVGLVTAWGLWAQRAWSFAAAAFLVVLAPTSSVLPLGDVIVEHRMYLPLAAVLTLLVGGLWGACQRWAPARPARWWTALLLVATVACSIRAYVRNAAYGSKVSLWESTVAQAPTNPRAYNNLGAALLTGDRLAEAERALRQALAIRPDYHQARCNLGTALMLQEHFPAALEQFKLAVTYCPIFPQAHRAMAECLLKLKQPQEALGAAQTALAQRPGYTEALTAVADAELRLQRPADALSHYEQALQTAMCTAATHNNYGCALLLLNRPADALAQFTKAQAMAPELADSYANLGDYYANHGRYDEAMAQYRAALVRRPTFIEAHVGLANCLFYTQQLPAALVEFEWAVQRVPDRTQVQVNYGCALAAAGRLADAEPHLRRALVLDPKLEQAHFNLGLMLQQGNRLPEALAEFLATVQLAPSNPDACFRAASAAWALGQRDLAQAQCAAALQLNPQHADALRLRAMMAGAPQ